MESLGHGRECRQRRAVVRDLENGDVQGQWGVPRSRGSAERDKKKASERIEGALAGTRKFIFTGRRLRSVS